MAEHAAACPAREPKDPIKVSQAPPSAKDLARVADISVYDAQGRTVRFGSLLSKDPHRRTLLLFIRHFFCGICQEYLRSLCASVTPDVLDGLPVPTDVVIVGHGQPELIDFYVQETACPYPIYAEPTKQIYSELGMGRTLDFGAARPEFMHSKSMGSVMWSGLVQSLSQGSRALKGGNYWQVGGEFLLQGDRFLFAHRMTHTRDHAEVSEIRAALGLDGNAHDDDDARSDARRKRWHLVLHRPGSLKHHRHQKNRAKESELLAAEKLAALEEDRESSSVELTV